MNLPEQSGVQASAHIGPREHEVVIVGAGQAGISLSHYLQQRRVSHTLLEKDGPFSSWRKRWNGFTTNTPNWMNTLPMLTEVYPSGDPKAFATREELLDYLHSVLEIVDPPVEVGVSVESVVQLESGSWEVRTDGGTYRAQAVAICSGAMSKPWIPELAAQAEGLVTQMHSSDYRTPSQIETDRVLIVGSASSGVQICRLLAESGTVGDLAMATSNVLTLPDRIMGIQTHRFLHALGLFDVTSSSLLGRLLYSGLETKGDPIMRPAPRDLARLHGVDLYGRFAGVQDGRIVFEDGRSISTEDLTVVWCTGFRGDYEFIEVLDRSLVFDPSGSPRHSRGVVTSAPGLYFVGLRYQHTVASHDLYGVGADAEHVAADIGRKLAASRPDATSGAGS